MDDGVKKPESSREDKTIGIDWGLTDFTSHQMALNIGILDILKSMNAT